MLTRCRPVDVPRVPRSAASRLPGRPASALKTASGGLHLIPPRRAWRTAPQAADASGKNLSGRPWSRRGAVLPQKKSEPSTLGCIGSALWENKTGLALDTLGWIANAVVPEASVGTAVVGAVLGVAGIAGATIDHTGPADAVVAGSLAYVGKQAAVGEGLLTGAASQLAHRIGVRALLASSLYDGAKTINRFTNCKRGE